MTTPIEDLIREELGKLQQDITWQLSDPVERAALAQMAVDLSMVPVRMARGEDCTDLLAALKAEGLNRALTHRIRVEAAAQRAWIAIVQRLIVGALTAGA